MAGIPETHYAKNGESCIAYQVSGDGPLNLVLIQGPGSHLDLQWENPLAARAFKRLASFTRLLRFDPLGTGLSDPADGPLTLEQQVDDLRAVLDAAGMERSAVLSQTDAGLGAMFAASRPERVTHLILCGVNARGRDLRTPERVERFLYALEHWNEGSLLEDYAPSRIGDSRFEEYMARYQRASASPSMARRIFAYRAQFDITGILPAIRVPTLVLQRTGDTLVPIELTREVAAAIPNATFKELPGTDNALWSEQIEPLLDAVEEFLTGSSAHAEHDRFLTTVLFTDIVDSTGLASRLGDHRWVEIRSEHDSIVRSGLERWRGTEIDTTGDGFLASFDGPARAVACAQELTGAVESLGVQIRAGIHTGECERTNGSLAGVAVHIGARIAALAMGGQVLVSRTVKDLVVGSGLQFAEHGTHELKGVPGSWELFAVESD